MISYRTSAKQLSYKIRLATISDADQIANLTMRTWHISLKNFVPTGFIDQFTHERQKAKYTQRAVDPEWTIFVAEADNKIIGMVSAHKNCSAPQLYEKEIKGMYVDPDFQTQGIGTSLLKSIFSELIKQRVTNTFLWCIEANKAARLFYEKHGGKQIKLTPPPEYSAMPHVAYGWKFSILERKG